MERIWKRGDVFYIESTMNTETPSGRPAVVVSSEKTYDRGLVQIVYLTTQPKEDLATHIDISSTQKTSIALCEQIRTVPITRLGDYICTCTDYEMQMIDIALAISLDLNFDGENEKSSKKIESVVTDSRNKNADSVTETAKSVIKTPESVTKPPESVIEPSEIVIKLTTERDTYKQLYENLLERMMR